MNHADVLGLDRGCEGYPLDLAFFQHLFLVELVLDKVALVCKHDDEFPIHPSFYFFLTFTCDSAGLAVAHLESNFQVLCLGIVKVAEY